MTTPFIKRQNSLSHKKIRHHLKAFCFSSSSWQWYVGFHVIYLNITQLQTMEKSRHRTVSWMSLCSEVHFLKCNVSYHIWQSLFHAVDNGIFWIFWNKKLIYQRREGEIALWLHSCLKTSKFSGLSVAF